MVLGYVQMSQTFCNVTKRFAKCFVTLQHLDMTQVCVCNNRHLHSQSLIHKLASTGLHVCMHDTKGHAMNDVKVEYEQVSFDVFDCVLSWKTRPSKFFNVLHIKHAVISSQ